MRDKKNIIILFIIFLIMVLSYVAYTSRHIVLGPQLLLNVPGGVVTVETQVIEVAGTAKNTTELKMNNNKLLLTPEGNFSEQMLLSVGNNTFIFDAKDKFGRSSQETLQVIYTPKSDDVLQLRDTTINQ